MLAIRAVTAGMCRGVEMVAEPATSGNDSWMIQRDATFDEASQAVGCGAAVRREPLATGAIKSKASGFVANWVAVKKKEATVVEAGVDGSLLVAIAPPILGAFNSGD